MAIKSEDFVIGEDILYIQPDPALGGGIELISASTPGPGEGDEGDTLPAITLQDANGTPQTTCINLSGVSGFDITTVDSIVRLSSGV